MSARIGVLHDSRWERWAGIGGVVFVVLSVVWALLYGPAPGAADSDEEIASWYADDGNRTQVWLAWISLMFAGLAFLWFLGSLRSILRRAEGEPGRLSGAAFAAGVVMTAVLFAKNATAAAPAIAINSSEENAALDPSEFRLFNALFHLLVTQEVIAGVGLIWFASVIALRTGVLPRSAAIAGLAVGIVTVVVLFLDDRVALVLLLAWVLLVSVLVLLGREPAPAGRET